MKCAAVFAVIISTFIVLTQGQSRTSVSRCLCQGTLVSMVRLQRVEKVEVYPVSPSCKDMEIIVTLKNGAGLKCLNPESKFAQNFIKKNTEKSTSKYVWMQKMNLEEKKQ